MSKSKKLNIITFQHDPKFKPVIAHRIEIPGYPYITAFASYNSIIDDEPRKWHIYDYKTGMPLMYGGDHKLDAAIKKCIIYLESWPVNVKFYNDQQNYCIFKNGVANND